MADEKKTESVSILGKYVLTKTDQFDRFMQELGVGLVMRKMANSATPTVEITVTDGVYSLKTSTTFKTTEIKFKLGEEFEETTADGRTVKATVTLDGNKLIHNQLGNKDKKEKDSLLIRTFKAEGFDMECKCGDVVATRFYARQ